MENYEKKYKEVLEKAKALYKASEPMSGCNVILETLFPELKESEDEKVKNKLINLIKMSNEAGGFALHKWEADEMLAWLEKQGTPAKLSEEEQNKFAKVVLRSCAMSFIDYLDAHKYEGKMCVSNGECEDIENAFHNAMWDKLHRYYCKYIEKQGEQKEYTFKSIPRLLDMIKPSDKAKVYCQKLIDTFAEEGYNTDAKIVKEVLKGWNGEDVPMAVMDEQKPANNFKPKFKIGDWIINPKTGNVLQIKNVLLCGNKGNYEFDYSSMPIESVDKHYHLWTIEDAKDGDVLCDYHETYDNPLIFILKRFEHVNFGLVRPSDYSSYCFLTAGDIQRFKEGTYHHEHNIKPATKEQRDLLFEKMKKAGYEWDAEKKELKKIHVIDEGKSEMDYCFTKMMCGEKVSST